MVIQKKVTLEAKQEEIFELLKYNLANYFRNRQNPLLWDIFLEEEEDRVELVEFQKPQIKEFRLVIFGEFITQWVDKNPHSANSFDFWQSVSQLFTFDVLPVGPKCRVIAQCHGRHPKIRQFFKLFWSELLEAYGLNEDRTPASKNEGGTPAVIENNSPSRKWDAIDEKIVELTRNEPRLTDDQLAAQLGVNMSRQAVNTRRRALEKAGFKVR